MPTEPPWIQQLAATARPERAALLESFVTAEFRTALLMTDQDELPYHESYFALGLTSLGATEIEQRLEAAFGRPINSASLLNNPTIDHLLSYLRTQVLAEFFPAAEESATPPEQPSGAVPRALVNNLLKDLYS